MSPKRISFLLCLGLITTLLSSAFCPAALPCGCVTPAANLTMYDLVKQAVERADLVFIGVPSVLHGDGSEATEDLVIFNTSTVFKGAEARKIGVHSGVGTTSMSSCGYSFEIGKTYLVFANHFEGFFLVAACSFTAPLEKSDVALRFLRKEPLHPEDQLTPTQIRRNENGRILGVIRRSDRVPLHDPKVYIWNDSDSSYEKEAWFTRPDKDGSFETYFLPPGAYRVTAVDSSYGPTRWVGCYALRPDDNNPGTVDVTARHDYRWVDIVLHEQKVYSIQGIVRSADNTPLPFEHAEIRADMSPNEMFPYLNFIQPHSDGKFYIPRVPVGIARLKTYVNQYVDPSWEPSTMDVEVNGDVENVEIVLTRKASGESDPPHKEDQTPD